MTTTKSRAAHVPTPTPENLSEPELTPEHLSEPALEHASKFKSTNASVPTSHPRIFKPAYSLKPVSKPLVSQKDTLTNTLINESTPHASASALVRIIANEDDDLYDPYSDYHDGTLKPQQFEEDPWR
ncbi:MAG: hypothetical protein U0O24_00165 [Eggerthellaceae bacterium]